MTPELKQLSQKLLSNKLSALAAQRAGKTRLDAAGWTVDTSRHFIDDSAHSAMMEFAQSKDVSGAIQRLFDSKIVNTSENRPALHWALRDQTSEDPEVVSVRQTTLNALKVAQDVIDGKRQTSSGAAFKSIVHIGIGGSDFGPRLLADAFEDHRRAGIELRFCANLDPLDLDIALRGLDPKETLVVGISKSFGTEETIYNLKRAKTWLEATLGATWPEHVILVTSNKQRADTFLDGIEAVQLPLPSSVGGRFSIWSAGCLSCMCANDIAVFEQFLAGANEMDQHVKTAPLESNVAVQLALLDVWNTSVCGFNARAVLAYSRRLRMLPTYLQQLEMESNGKSSGPNGETVTNMTAPMLWGGEGTIGQHSYHQWLHQGTHTVPTEFIVAPGSHSDAEGVEGLRAHALAQAEVLANGRSLEDVTNEEPDLEASIKPQKVHAGGRPSTLITTEELTPAKLGSLIALYEHRTYIAGILWGVNSFDQWGVERGKTMAQRLKPALRGSESASDPVTSYLTSLIK